MTAPKKHLFKEALDLARVAGLLTFLLLAVGASAWAKAKRPAPAKGPHETSINFNDELVKGGAQNPELFYLLEQKQFNYGRLIQLRNNFLPEMKSTSEDMKR